MIQTLPNQPAIARTMPAGESIDGTTLWSDELDMPGPPRLLAWCALEDNSSPFQLHTLWDTTDLDLAMLLAKRNATEQLGRPLTSGWLSATANDWANARTETFG
jgi:hypothetical protein